RRAGTAPIAADRAWPRRRQRVRRPRTAPLRCAARGRARAYLPAAGRCHAHDPAGRGCGREPDAHPDRLDQTGAGLPARNGQKGGGRSMDSELAGQTALVTGRSRGIGKATAFALAAEGVNVVISSRRQEALDEVAEELRQAHPGMKVLAKAAHVAEEDDARA